LIRVFCRIKPFIRNESAKQKSSVKVVEEILCHFEQAFGKKTTKATMKMKNSTSFRSHFVSRIDILGERDGDRSLGHLYFIDLACSEALDASHNEKQNAEGTAIRNSLTALKTFLIRSANNERTIIYVISLWLGGETFLQIVDRFILENLKKPSSSNSK
jgi:hypothetical protein